jgi:hypothetical protein
MLPLFVSGWQARFLGISTGQLKKDLRARVLQVVRGVL